METIDISHLLGKEDYRPLRNDKKEQIDIIADLRKMNESNEAVDILITGMRGDGKSTLAMGICHRLDLNFSVNKICFDMHEFITLVDTLPHGSAILMDESGTVESGMSCRQSMSSENQEFNDVWRKVRTKGIYFVVISPDKDDIDKRVRSSFRFICTPVAKLSNDDTNGNGMAIKSLIVENFKEYDDVELFKMKKRYYKGIKFVTIAAPPASLIYNYEKKRDRSLNYSIQMATSQKEEKKNLKGELKYGF